MPGACSGRTTRCCPNYHWVPIGYHGRSSSVVVSGTPVVRPMGQTKAPDAPAPSFGPSKRLDFELELGFVIGPGNPLGKPVPIARALDHVFGVTLFNDWSARDIQAWEYQPLGPFLGQELRLHMSPWIVTLEALEPFRCAAFRRSGDQPHRFPTCPRNPIRKSGNFDIQLEAHLRTPKMPRPHCLSRSNFRHSYWTPAQIVTHQASNGCNLQPGDLLGSGTISGPTPDALGALLEMTQGGKNPVALPNGETRAFLEDGDELILRGVLRARRLCFDRLRRSRWPDQTGARSLGSIGSAGGSLGNSTTVSAGATSCARNPPDWCRQSFS